MTVRPASMAGRIADRAAARLGRDVYLFAAGHQELG
jgi:hypothetical protein